MLTFRNILAAIAAVAALFVLSIVAAAAQADTGISGTDIFAVFRPYLVELLGLLIAVGVGFAARQVQKFTGITIEARHRETLQSALTNGANLAIGKVERHLTERTIDLKNPAVAAAVQYVLDNAPDAARHFGLGPNQVVDLLRPKLARHLDVE